MLCTCFFITFIKHAELEIHGHIFPAEDCFLQHCPWANPKWGAGGGGGGTGGLDPLGRGLDPPGKSQVAIGFPKNLVLTSLEKQLDPPPLEKQGPIASRGRSLRPSVKYVDMTLKKKHCKATTTPHPPREFSGSAHALNTTLVLFVCVSALLPSQQFFSHPRMISCTSTKQRIKFLLKDTIQ